MENQEVKEEVLITPEVEEAIKKIPRKQLDIDSWVPKTGIGKKIKKSRKGRVVVCWRKDFQG